MSTQVELIIFTDTSLLKKNGKTIKSIVTSLSQAGDISVIAEKDHKKLFALVDQTTSTCQEAILQVETSNISSITIETPHDRLKSYQVFKNCCTEGYIIMEKISQTSTQGRMIGLSSAFKRAIRSRIK